MTTCSGSCDVAVVLFAFCIEVLDGRLLFRVLVLDEPEATAAVLLDAYIARSICVDAVERSKESRGSCTPFGSSTEVVDSTVVVSSVVLSVAALATQYVHLQVFACAFECQADSHAVLFLFAYIGDTCSFVEFATLEDGLPSLIQVLRIDFPNRAVAQAGSTSHEETAVLSETNVLDEGADVLLALTGDQCAITDIRITRG